ncbi:MAG: HK97 family phage prohead protease [Syntrophales bacterium]|nr:HK97 family phage prohead protease [Syntrophales bacterium]MDD5640102.1 HK97 family phage prohead protease [Syntrophales bacterium]
MAEAAINREKNPTFHKALDIQVRQVGDPAERVLEFIASTAQVDRYGDIIEVEGWELDNWLKVPVILYGHDYGGFPIGQGVSAIKDPLRGLVIQAKFATAQENPEADIAYRLALGGYIRAVSVGFMDLEREPILDNEGNRTGWRFKRAELLEVSLVAVPANPGALIVPVQKGLLTQEEAEAFQAKMQEAAEESQEQQGDDAPENKKHDDLNQRLIALGLPPTEGNGDCSGTLLALCDLAEDQRREIEELRSKATLKVDLSLSEEQLTEIREQWEALLRGFKADIPLLMVKAGAVLSAKNKAALAEARDRIQAVLDAAEGSGQEEGKTKITDYYSLAMDPESEVPGNSTGDDPDLNKIFELTQEVAKIFKLPAAAG